MTDATATPAGFAPVFPGWNVWDVWQADTPDQNVLGSIWTAGESEDRLLQVWVENELADNAPGVSVSDPLNPAALKGDQVQIIPSAQGLTAAATRASIPEIAGTLQLGTADSTARERTVRFYNRGSASVLPWPHDQNFVVDSVYTPSTTNPITSAPAPSSLAGAAGQATAALGHVVEVLAWGAGAIAAALLVSKLLRRS